MAPKKQLTENEKKPEVNEDSVAADSLHPGARAVDDPKSMTHASQQLAAMIGAFASMDKDSKTQWFDKMMAFQKEVGHGMGVKDGQSEANKKTIETHASVKEEIAKDVAKILGEQEGLSEDFKTKATTLFEAAVEARVKSEVVRIEEELNEAFGQELQEVAEKIAEGVEEFLNYAADQWMTENEVAIESALRNEIAEDFMSGLRNLFVENNFNIPEDKVELVDTMAQRIEELESRLSDAINENAELRKKQEEDEVVQAIEKAAEGLTVAESEKFKQLAESVDFDSIEDLQNKLTTIKESTFVKDAKKSVLAESMEEVNEDNLPAEDPTKGLDPQMKTYVNAVSRTLRR